MTIILTVVTLLFGLLLGWLLGGRGNGALAAARDAEATARRELEQRFARAVQDLEAADTEREAHAIALAQARSTLEADARAHAAQIATLTEARDSLSAQFQEVAAKLLDRAQAHFLEQAGERFKASETAAGTQLAALLQPVHQRLQSYEDTVRKVESERKEAYGSLSALMENMRQGQEAVKDSANSLMNSLRNAPKARGRWGEQQLRNVLETCGLSEYSDFQTEVSTDDSEGRRLRPDVIIRVPGGQSLVVDAKVSLNAYQDAFNTSDDTVRQAKLVEHAASVKAHIVGLGNRSYQEQFNTPVDFVVLFIPGEHFLSAALETVPDLWDFAFDKKVLLATPTNLIAIARTVSAVWRQETLARDAEEIRVLGKDLYARMLTMGGFIAKLGKNLETATGAYNDFVGSFESRVLTQARKFDALPAISNGKQIESLPVVDTAIRQQTKLQAFAATDDVEASHTAPNDPDSGA